MKRNSNFELFRIICMCMITISHLLGQGKVFENTSETEFVVSIHFLEAVCNVAVNYFVLLSGFFQIRTNIKKIVSLLLQLQFYSILSWGISCIFVDRNEFNLISLIRSIFPVLNNQWWYMSCYIGLVLLSPLLNKSLKSIGKQQLKIGLCIAVLLFSVIPTATQLLKVPIFLGSIGDGFTLSHFILLYSIGFYLACYIKNAKKTLCIAMYIFSTIIIGVINIRYSMIGGEPWYTYNNIFVIAQSIALLLLVQASGKALPLPAKTVNRIASMTLPVYLMSNHKLIRSWLYLEVCQVDKFYNTPLQIPMILFDAIAIFAICISIEYIREEVEKLFLVSKKIANQIEKIPIVNKLELFYFIDSEKQK